MEQFEEEVEKWIGKLMSERPENRNREFYIKIARELKKVKFKYWSISDDEFTKARLLRNLLLTYDELGEDNLVKESARELYLLAKESELKEYYEGEYCRAMNCYTEVFSNKLDQKEKIKIEKENMNIYRKMGLEYKPDFLTAKVNIFFLMEDYNSVVSVLLEIHTNEVKRMIDLKGRIIEELKKCSKVHYNKYIELSNMADSLVS